MNNPYQNFWGNQKIGKGCKFGAFVDIGDDVEFGENCKIECFVSIPPGWKIGNNVFIGPHVSFANDKHPKAQGDWQELMGFVKDGASIGMHASIGAGITIGRNAVIGQHTNILTDVPDNETWISDNKARKLR